MFYSKLKLMGTLVLAVAVSAGIGLSYRARAADPTRPGRSAPAARAAADELEELRLEVAALRKGLEAMRARVQLLESERHAAWSRNQPGKEAPNGLPGRVEGAGTPTNPYRVHVTTTLPSRETHVEQVIVRQPRVVKEVTEHIEVRPYKVRLDTDPITEAEAALQKLRKDPNDKQAMQALVNAWKKMKERTTSKPAPKPRTN